MSFRSAEIKTIADAPLAPSGAPLLKDGCLGEP